MTDWRHDEWCSTFLDGAPESDCDCVRKTLIQLEAELLLAKLRLSAANGMIRRAIQAIVDEGDPDVGRPWLVEKVLGILMFDKKATATDIREALGISQEDVDAALLAIKESKQPNADLREVS